METYFVAKNKTGGFLGHFTIEEIAKRLSYAEISGDYLVTKSSESSHNNTIKSSTVQWITVRELLASQPIQQQTVPVTIPSPISEPGKRKCPFCAEEINIDAVKCKHCGEFLSEALREESEAGESPIGFIISGWIFMALTFFSRAFGSIGIIFEIVALILAIALAANKNSTAKTNGWVILILWIVWGLIGFMSGYINTVNRFTF